MENLYKEKGGTGESGVFRLEIIYTGIKSGQFDPLYYLNAYIQARGEGRNLYGMNFGEATISIAYQSFEVSQEPQDYQLPNCAEPGKSYQDSLSPSEQRLRLVRQVFEQCRRKGLPAPTLSEFDLLEKYLCDD